MFNFLNTADPKANRNRLVLLLVAVMIVGMIAGATMNRNPSSPVTETQTQTITETKVQTPQSCLDYIEYSETGFGLAEESMTYAGDAFEAIGKYDLDAATKAGEDMRSVKPKLDELAPKLLQAKADCKASK